eukprot:2931374-Rhodomonas_salina.1
MSTQSTYENAIYFETKFETPHATALFPQVLHSKTKYENARLALNSFRDVSKPLGRGGAGGFIAPYLLKFVPPPSAQNLRFSTQCRKARIPKP